MSIYPTAGRGQGTEQCVSMCVCWESFAGLKTDLCFNKGRLTHSTLRTQRDNTPRIGREGACVRNSDIQAVGTPPLAPQYHTRLSKPEYLDAVRTASTPQPPLYSTKTEEQCAGRGKSYPIRQYREHHKTTSLAAAIFEEEAKSEGEEASMLAILPCSARFTACLTCERNENQDYCWQ